jgi:hypothetical protein
MTTFQHSGTQPQQSLGGRCRTGHYKRVSHVRVRSEKDSYPVLCMRFTSSSILRLPALWSGSDRPTPRSWAGRVGIVDVGTGLELEDFCDESDVVGIELTEGVDIVDLSRRCLFRMGVLYEGSPEPSPFV